MIWTAASAISASASWGRMRRMETILATSPSLSIPSGCLSLLISLKNPLLSHLLSLSRTVFFPFFLILYISVCASLSLSPFHLSASAAWLIVTAQLHGWHMHQSLTKGNMEPRNTFIHKKMSSWLYLYSSHRSPSFNLSADVGKFDQSKQKIII